MDYWQYTNKWGSQWRKNLIKDRQKFNLLEKKMACFFFSFLFDGGWATALNLKTELVTCHDQLCGSLHFQKKASNVILIKVYKSVRRTKGNLFEINFCCNPNSYGLKGIRLGKFWLTDTARRLLFLKLRWCSKCF